MEQLHWTYFDAYASGGVEFGLTLKDAESCAGGGDQEDNVRTLLSKTYVSAQLDKLGHRKLADALRGYGAWDDAELADEDMTRVRFVWCAACSIAEEAEVV